MNPEVKTSKESSNHQQQIDEDKTSIRRLAVCVAGIYFFYLLYGIEQEKLSKLGFRNTLLLLFIQCITNAFFALAGYIFNGAGSQSKSLISPAEKSPFKSIYRFLIPTSQSHNGHVWLALLSASYLLAMAASNYALHYVSYTAQVLGKSVKMIPVMLANVLIAGKKYTLSETIAVVFISFGIFVFSLDKVGKSSHGSGASASGGNVPAGWFDITWDESTIMGLQGSLLLLTSLALDGVTSSNQKLFDDEFKPSTHGIMLYMNVWSVIFLSIAIFMSGDAVRGLKELYYWDEIHADVILFALSSAMGQNFIFYTITGPGPLACTTITTTRKFFTILASVMLWPENRLTTMQWAGVVFVFVGLLLEIYEKYQEKKHGKHKASGKSQ